MTSYAEKSPLLLSGGEQQRIAVARAFANDPLFIIADEPTGNLDTKTAAEIFELFRKFNQQFGCAVLLVTHDARLSTTCDRTITLVDGQTV
jgi:lipoprotein-releasing system ATP-binding protein